MKRLLFISFIIFVLIDAIFIEPNKLVSVSTNLYIPNWSKRLDGLKVAVFSDLHVGTHFVPIEKVERIINEVNSNKPDLIIIPGDLDAMAIAHSETNQEQLANVLSCLSAKYGCYAVMGNHDYYPEKIVKSIWQDAGVTLLENDSEIIFIKGIPLKIVGLKDFYYHSSSIFEMKDALSSRFSTILISHNPDVFPYVPHNVALTISGHTHGGEFNIPIIGSITVPSKYFQRYSRGYIVEQNKHLFVTTGVATLSRLRFHNPPEIVYLTLYSQTEGTKITNKGNLNLLKINLLLPIQKIIKAASLSNPLAF